MRGPRVALADNAAPEHVQPAFEAGLRTLMGRALVIRVVTWGTTVVILRFVTPADLGVLVVTQAFFGLTGFVAEWGYTSYLIRRRARPETTELAAFASVQLGVALAVVAAILAVPGSQVDAWVGMPDGKTLLIAVAIGQVFAYGQNGSKAVLEREMNFAVLARIDVATLLIQSVILTIAAVLGRYVGAIPVALVTSQLIGSAVFAIHVPRAWRLTLAFRPLRNGVRDASAFATKGLADTLKINLLPLAISALFGLPILGAWSVATRLAQINFVIFESFWRAGFPAASRLIHEPEMLDQMTESSFSRAMRLSTPIALLVVIGAPLMALLFPLWTPAIMAAQVWSLAYAASGSVSATLSPRQVTLAGPRVLVIEAILVPTVTLGMLVVLGFWHSTLAVAVAYVGGAIASVVVLSVSARGPLLRDLMAKAAFEGGVLIVVGISVMLGSLWSDSTPAMIAAGVGIVLLLIVRRPSITRLILRRRGADNSGERR